MPEHAVAARDERGQPLPDGGPARGAGSSEGQSAGNSTGWGRFAPNLLRIVVVFTASRLAVLASIVIATKIEPGLSLRAAFYKWDAGWYVRAIEEWYPSEVPERAGRAVDSVIGFFPLFSGTARALHTVLDVSGVVAGTVVATLFGLLSAALLWLLAARLSDRETADRAVVLYCFFPSSMALLLPFSEGMMISFSIACVIALLDRRWVLAGIAGAMATAARPTAVVLVGCCAWASLEAIWRRRDWRSLIAPLLAPAGIIAYFVFLAQRYDEALVWFRVEEEGWNNGTDLGVRTLQAARQVVTSNPLIDLNALSSTIALVFAIVSLIILVRWKPPTVVTLYALGLCVLVFTSAIVSRPRYMLAVFPFFIAWAARLRSPTGFATATGFSAAMLAAYSILVQVTLLVVF